jgi:branched-chain amino acid transport system permease protein
MRAVGKSPFMAVHYADDLRLLPSVPMKLAMVALALVYALAPFGLSDVWLNVLNYAAAFAVAAIGLNLLTGYTGQVSLGHAFFMGCGAYVAARYGVRSDLPLMVYLPLAAVVGAAVGAAIGPFALRLRGDYLVIITLGLIFAGDYLFDQWDTLTGGGAGTSTAAPLRIGPLNFADLELFGRTFTRDEGIFLLFWAIVAVGALLGKNLVRSRAGRAMQAVRDRDLAAEIIGVSLFRYKVGAFAVAGAYAAVAGAMYAALQQYVSPTEWNLFLSIQIIAMIILGGVGTIMGGIIGAIVLRVVPKLIEQNSGSLPFVSSTPGSTDGIISAPSLNNVLFGLMIVLFLAFEPRGLAAVWQRAKAYFKAWPFSY